MNGRGFTGESHGFIAFNENNEVYNTVSGAFETWNDLNIADYIITATEVGTTGYFIASDPSDGIEYYELRFLKVNPPTAVSDTEPTWARDVIPVSDIKSSLSGHDVTLVSPVSEDGTKVELIQGDTYSGTLDRALRFSNSNGTWGAGDITGATPELIAVAPGDAPIELTGTVVSATGTQVVEFELTKVQSASFDRAGNVYQLQVRLTHSDSSVETIVRGRADIIRTLFS